MKGLTLKEQLLDALGALPTAAYLPGETEIATAEDQRWLYWGPDGQPITGLQTHQGVLRQTRLGGGANATTITTTYVAPKNDTTDLPWQTQISGGPIAGFARAYATPAAARLGHDLITARLAGLLGVTPAELNPLDDH